MTISLLGKIRRETQASVSAYVLKEDCVHHLSNAVFLLQVRVTVRSRHCNEYSDLAYQVLTEFILREESKSQAYYTLGIEIGSEVREQNNLPVEMDDDFGKSGGLLEKTMSRLQKMAKAGHNCYMLYLLLFSMFVFFVLWLIIKSR